MSNVKLGIRVRPFTDRELKSDKDRTPVVNVVDASTVTITNVKVSVSGAGDSRERVRRYSADYTFDSACPPADDNYASQDTIFRSIGSEVLESLHQGVSCCVLAYGQSATGKTHTMMGSDAQPGLVPRLCHALADRPHFQITVSFLEIYNERVHDLLAAEEVLTPCASLPRRKGNARKDLRVREHPTKGTYVQNLRHVVVHDIETLLQLVKEGGHRRRTAATRRNSSSSRSHALLNLSINDVTLHLADLAGSEKASWEGCGGGRQKEGANINKSLVALSNVISALVNAGTGRGQFVPYRDSALTWLLKDCFIGGAKTFIIATVSPSVACYGESASTLRWATRARQLPGTRPLNHPAQSSRAALQAHLNRLIAELASNFITYVPETGLILYEDSHWELIPKKFIKLRDDTIETGKIGNIMKPLLPKPDNQNSESTASSVASGSSDIINTIDKNITNEINKEMDKFFGPSLERARSGGDLKVIAPHRNKRRQYKSQEVLPIVKTIGSNQILASKEITLSEGNKSEETNTDSNVDIKEKGEQQHVPIFYDNQQRAEIVASVTERLYTKLKKKEETAVAKMENVVEKKIMEPLSELRICTNARQRLMELSQKAMRNKRRIGIPAHTQTRKFATRVREQGIDVQIDLEPHYIKEKDIYIPHQDASTETNILTPLCKEIAVGPKCGSIKLKDISTETEQKKVNYKNSHAMTEGPEKCDRCTQTIIVPPPRRKKRASPFAKYLRSGCRTNHAECIETPVININISQSYPTESEPHISDESPENLENNCSDTQIMPPDLITNHNNVALIEDDDTEIPKKIVENHIIQNPCPSTSRECPPEYISEFPPEDHSLPRVTVNSLLTSNRTSMEDLILGRNENIFPYNIVLSPPRDRESFKRTVQFKETDTKYQPPIISPSKTSSASLKSNFESELSNSEQAFVNNSSNEEHVSSSSDSSKADSDTFYWKSTRARPSSLNGFNAGHVSKVNYNPVNKSPLNNKNRYRTAKAKFYREFLGIEKEELKKFPSTNKEYNKVYEGLERSSQEEFQKKKLFFEEKFVDSHFAPKNSFSDIERKIYKSCDALEASVNKYDSYLSSCYGDQKSGRHCGDVASTRTPREYLQHLVHLRREAVKYTNDEGLSSCSSGSRLF